MAQLKPSFETFAKIKVVGVGGSGGNALAHMLAKKIRGVEFLAVNTDAQDLHHVPTSHKVHIGAEVTRGLGAGMDPNLGRQAAEESRKDIEQSLKGADMVFITCGLGGGTGSGAAPVIAQIARESADALVIGVVTKPFYFEGRQRAQIAEDAWRQLKDQVDALVTIPNDRVLTLVDRKTPLTGAFKVVDNVLAHAVQGISDLIVTPGLINLDFADVRTTLTDAGSALMGIGQGLGEGRAALAAKAAVSSPLLEISAQGARRVLFNVRGGPDLTMAEVEEAAKIITEAIDPGAKVIFGAVIDPRMRKGAIQITVIAADFGVEQALKDESRDQKQESQGGSATMLQVDLQKKESERSSSPLRVSVPQMSEPGWSEEELDIPAFIRRKIK